MTDELASIEYLVIGTYLLVLIGLGVAVRRFSKNASDYFRNGCRGAWWLVGASAFMQMFSAWTFTGAAGAAFEAGWSVIIIFAGNALCFFLVFLFLGPWFRQLRAITSPEVIRMRFGATTQQFYAWLQVLLGLLNASVWLWGLSTFVASVFDLSAPAASLGLSEVQLLIVVSGAIVLIYSVAGGSWAVMATDFLQGLILLPLTLLIAYLSLKHIGGFGAMLSQIEAQGLSEKYRLVNDADDFPLGKYGLWFAIATIIYKSVTNSTIVTAQKYFGVKDGAAARKAGLFACLLMVAGMVVWFVPPIVARLTMADEVLAADLSKPAEASYALISLHVLPTGLIGLMVVAMLSATMSSMDSGLNRNAAVFVRDIGPYFGRLAGRPDLSERGQFVMGQIVSVFLGVAIIGTSLYFAGVEGHGVFEWMLTIGALVGLPIAIPIFMGLFIRRAPWWAAIASILITVIPSSLGFVAGSPPSWIANSPVGPLVENPWPYERLVFVNLAVGITVFLLTLPFWKNASAAYRTQVNDFFIRMHTPVDFESEVGAANDDAQLRTIGTFALVMGAFIGLLILVPGNDTPDRLAILFVSGCVAITGAAMLWAGARMRNGRKAVESERVLSRTAEPRDAVGVSS